MFRKSLHSPPVTAHYRRYPPGPLLHEIADLDNPAIQTETVLRIATTSVVLADYSLLQHDFPQLEESYLLTTHPELHSYRGQKRELAIQRIIDEWLLHNASFISESRRLTLTVRALPPRCGIFLHRNRYSNARLGNVNR